MCQYCQQVMKGEGDFSPLFLCWLKTKLWVAWVWIQGHTSTGMCTHVYTACLLTLWRELPSLAPNPHPVPSRLLRVSEQNHLTDSSGDVSLSELFRA